MSILKPISVKSQHGGTQALYRFPNGYGASVVQHSFSYGGDQGLWELGVLVWEGEQYGLTYSTPITDDVLGHLGEGDVAEVLQRIAALPERSAS
ncbi:hypothetical protein ACQEU3_47220 [Spirillospora sp. CA-253888]